MKIIKKLLFFLKNICKSEFKSIDFWEERYTNGENSGIGSYGKLANFKAKILNNFIKQNKIKSIIEFGCGDGNQLSMINIKKYMGLDVSKKSIEICGKKFSKDKTKSFFLYDPNYFVDNLKVFNSQLSISLDVIFHIVEEKIFNKYMHDLFDSSKEYVIIYSSNTRRQQKKQGKHVYHRKFTEWIKNNKKDWNLIEIIKNKYPTESFSSFYIYKIKIKKI